jgi:TRAP-type mannitol/chloroaromatic compound transport system permease large subunit
VGGAYVEFCDFFDAPSFAPEFSHFGREIIWMDFLVKTNIQSAVLHQLHPKQNFRILN